MSISETPTINICDPSLSCCLSEPAFQSATVSQESNSTGGHTYWDIYTNDQIPVLERAIGGALLPVAIVGSLFGAGCGGEEKKVTDPQFGPVISPIPDKRVMVSRLLSIPVSATDANWNDTLTWTVQYRSDPNGVWQNQLPNGATFDEDPCEYNSCHFNNESLAAGTLTWTPSHYDNTVGSYEFRFEISDGSLTDIKTCHVEVTPYVPPPPPPPPSPWSPDEFDSCPQAVMNQEGTISAAWMNRVEGGVQRLVMARNANRGDKTIVGTREANICDGNKAIDYVDETNIRLCWKESEALTCQTFDENIDPLDDAQQMALGNDGGYSMQTFEDGIFAMAWVSAGHIYLQIFAGSGYPNTLPIDLGEGEKPDLDTAGDDLIVAWITPPGTPSNKHVQVKKYSKTGEPLTLGWELINGILQRGSYPSDPRPEISISMNRDGFFAIGAVGDRTGREVFMGIYDMQGRQQSGYRNPDFPDDEPGFALEEVAHPRVVLNDEGYAHFSFSGRRRFNSTNFIANGRYTYWSHLEPLDPVRTYGGGSGDINSDLMPGYALATNGEGMKLVYGLETPVNTSYAFPLTTVTLPDLPQEPVIPDGPSIFGVGSTVDFGNVMINETGTVSLTFENRGLESLEIQVDPLPEEPFSVGSTFLTISPLGSRTFSVSFNPTEIGDHTGSLTLNTNDLEVPTVTYTLTGHGGLP